ncbi:MAG TPA: hypothetical protein VGO27_03785, partial [Candidatus Acidoferrum sp.]|nr:hypothetical protein [Candidatus Acidoferrum sp.]
NFVVAVMTYGLSKDALALMIGIFSACAWAMSIPSNGPFQGLAMRAWRKATSTWEYTLVGMLNNSLFSTISGLFTKITPGWGRIVAINSDRAK